MSLAQISAAYTVLLKPIPFFTSLGTTVSPLDLLSAFRLCLIMRQIREEVARNHAGKVEESSFTKHLLATLFVVCGGEAVTFPWLGLAPSYLLYPGFPLLYIGVQAIVEYLPKVPRCSFELEAPLTVLDALSRSYLLVDLIPPAILKHSNPALSTSPWALLVVTFITANAGFFMVNLFSMFNPSGWSLATPAELQPYGWTTVDLWVAPLIAGVMAFLTNAQPFWTHLRLLAESFMRPVSAEALEKDPITVWSTEDARALGAVILWALFAARTVRNFGPAWWNSKPKKKEVMRSKVDGKRYPSNLKAKKTQ